jgi:hypothetical protein
VRLDQSASIAVLRIAAGRPDRDYSHLFFDYDIACMGPGQPLWGEDPDEAFGTEARSMRAFVAAPVGGVALMNCGAQVRGLGIIAGKLVRREVFAEVTGWNLGQTRRVRWVGRSEFTEPPPGPLRAPRGTARFMWADRTMLDWAHREIERHLPELRSHPLKHLPKPEPHLDWAKLDR